MKRLLVTSLLALTLPLAHAQVRPPVAPPTGLPPLPNSRPPLPPTGLPNDTRAPVVPVPDPTPVPPPQEEPQNTNTIAKYDAEKVAEALQQEVNRLVKAIPSSVDMRVVFGNTQSDAYRQQVALGNIKPSPVDPDTLGGVTAVYQMGNALNSSQPNVCYVLFNPEKGESQYYSLWQPLSEISHPQTPYAWAVGHAMGHCLDQWERTKIMSRRLQWKADNALELGLLPQAVQQVYGNQVVKAQFMSQPYQVFALASQQQYTERVADAFGLAWIMKLGASPESIDRLLKLKKDADPSGAHQTTSTLEIMSKQGQEIARLRDIDLLWSLAKQARQARGITQDAQMASSPMVQTPDNEIVQYKVTPQGLVPVNAQGQVVNDPRRPLVPKRNFNQAKRFGQPPIR